IADLEKRSQKRDTREIALVILIRTLTNLSVLLILIGAGVAIFMAAQLGLDSQLSGESLQLEGFVLPIVFTAFNISLPILFSFLARSESSTATVTRIVFTSQNGLTLYLYCGAANLLG
ncbi:hypothetical protein GBAR_LOCUS1899, partial [Geodia barretti]